MRACVSECAAALRHVCFGVRARAATRGVYVGGAQGGSGAGRYLHAAGLNSPRLTT